MKPFQGINHHNTALLIIDVMNSCASPECETPEWNIHFSKIRKMVPSLINFIQDFKKTVGGRTFYVKSTPWRKEFLAENVNELYEQEQFAYYSKDSTGKDKDLYGVTPDKNDKIFEKNTCDALTNPELVNELKKNKIKYLIVTGVFTDGCVLASVLGGFSQGFNMVVLKDLCETTDSPTRQLIQQKLFEFTFPYMFARVITSKELLDSFSK